MAFGMLNMINVIYMIVLGMATVAASPTPTLDVNKTTCKVFVNTDFQGHDVQEQDENTSGDCCSACAANKDCGFWTFAPPTTCNLKSSDAGKRPSPVSGPNAYTSGCRNEACSPAPSPPPPPPPIQQVCNTGTVCGAYYAVNRAGCCPYENATCCPNQQTCCPSGTSCVDNGTYETTCKGAIANQTVGLSVCKSGAALPFSKTLPNVLIVGDSVSIGYTPHVTRLMASRAMVQHSPYDASDGGAEETAYGVQCLKVLLTSTP
jgi:hypothetical protein